ncbi:MAG: TonB-dependent receptor [Gammaproteobacteria bacterium]|nr:TonB-dependent receptor [Gammaproteobacteria bacterium]
MHIKWFTLLPAFALAAIVTPLAMAAEGDEVASGVEEVIVTSQRREQKLVDVPIAVNVLSGEMIEEADIHDLEGIASRTPSLNFAPFSPGQNIITLRGASSNDDGAGTDNSVALFLDDVYLGRTSNISFEMADLERVEVLRGPQGTLFGKNTIGGAINVITRKPSVEESYGAINLTTGNYSLRYASGYYSTPLSDTWAIKVTGSSRTRDGWVENVLRPNDNQKNQNAQVVRTQALYQGSKTSVLMSLDANFLDVDDMGRVPIAGAALDQYKTDTGLKAFDRKVSSNPVDGFAKRYASGASVKVEHNFNDRLSLFYIFAVRKSLLDWEMDSAGASSTDLNDNILDDTISTQSELRLNINREYWNTTVGLWSSTEGTDRTESFDLTIPAGTLSDSYTQENFTASSAIFVNTEYYSGKAFYIGFGGRFSADAKAIDSTSTDGTVILCGADDDSCTAGDVVSDIPFIINDNFTSKDDGSWSAFTPKLTVGFRLGSQRNHNIYVGYATGYKSGGFAAAPTAKEHLRPLDPEGSVSIELGYKGEYRWGSSSIARVNLTLFTSSFNDLQIQQFGAARLPNGETSGFGFFRTINASAADIQGMELEIYIRPSQYFFVSMTGTSSNSEYTDGKPLHTGATFNGQKLLRVPNWKASVVLGGDIPTGAGHIFRWNIDYRFESDTSHDLSNPLAVSPDHSITDIRFAWLAPQGFELAAWGRNVGDATWIQHIYTIGPGTIAVFGEPYTYGFTMKYSF